MQPRHASKHMQIADAVRPLDRRKREMKCDANHVIIIIVSAAQRAVRDVAIPDLITLDTLNHLEHVPKLYVCTHRHFCTMIL